MRIVTLIEDTCSVPGCEAAHGLSLWIETARHRLLLDAGPSDLLLSNAQALGVDLRQAEMLVLSHGHYDHIGSTTYYKSLSGAKTYISRIDNEIVNGNRPLSWANELGHEVLPFFNCDVLLEDGDTVTLCNTTISCRLTPGHTEGTMCFFFEIEDNGHKYTAAMHGGVGTNSMEAWFLDKYNLDYNLRNVFRRDLRQLAKIPVDVVLGNHPDQSDTEDKLARILNGDAHACINPAEWPRFMKACEDRLDRMIAAEK